MSQLDFTTALARLLSDASLRAEFAADPTFVANRLAGHPDDIAAVVAIDPSELEHQAVGLIRKRAGHVAALLPLTWAAMSNPRTRFDDFAAENSWPEGHQRHLEDAVAFGKWLDRQGDSCLVPSEWNRCRFLIEHRRLRVCLIRHRSIPLRERGVRFLFRARGRIHQWRIWLPVIGW